VINPAKYVQIIVEEKSTRPGWLWQGIKVLAFLCTRWPLFHTFLPPFSQLLIFFIETPFF